MLKEALTKLQAEITSAATNKYVSVVGAYMMDRIRNHPEEASKVLTEGKTLAGSLDSMRKEAQKAGNDGVLTSDEGFAVVLEYFGIDVPKREEPAPVVGNVGFNVDLDALLEG